ncbi:MAG: BON domain-containing protein [Candidatus Melainabacteria bacterium]|nr:BON domain-containing protein [Candidatus Melainabacteria bacterium]MBI3307865.1 BON domain-containing protein [Candidatus Melainabacteria bacterium]
MTIVSTAGVSGGDDPYSSVREKLLKYGIRNVDFVDVQGTSTVQITGTVSTYYQKQMAQEILRSMVGRTIVVDNNVEVKKVP